MKKHHLYLVGMFATLLAAGCATSNPAPSGLKTDSVSSCGIKILSVGLAKDNQGLLVHGSVVRTDNCAESPFNHLDVEVCGPTGELLSQQSVTFFPNPILHSRHGSGRSSYAIRMDVVPPAGSVIRVTVHPVPAEKCSREHSPQDVQG